MTNEIDASPVLATTIAMTGAVAVRAELHGNDTARSGDLIARGRSPVFSLCRALLAAGADPDARLECFRGDVLALTVKTIGAGAALTIEESATRGPKVVRWKPFSRADVEPHVRPNDDPARTNPLPDSALNTGGGADVRAAVCFQ